MFKYCTHCTFDPIRKFHTLLSKIKMVQNKVLTRVWLPLWLVYCVNVGAAQLENNRSSNRNLSMCWNNRDLDLFFEQIVQLWFMLLSASACAFQSAIPWEVPLQLCEQQSHTDHQHVAVAHMHGRSLIEHTFPRPLGEGCQQNQQSHTASLSYWWEVSRLAIFTCTAMVWY